jgi:NADH:ubiquinone oxidoreductase subunit 3 (subunit A)
MSLSAVLLISYGVMFALAIFVPGNFVAVAFDSGGVTTGPITVPFIMAMGIGLASIRGSKESQNDSFGFVAICSVGPILAVMLLGIFYNPQEAVQYNQISISSYDTMHEVVQLFTAAAPETFRLVLTAIVPIAVFFIVFQILTRRYKKRQLARISVGIVYTLIGLVLFLTGVEVGFIPVGSLLGSELAGSAYKWLLIPIGLLVGYFIVEAEPAIHVLNSQVEEISGGTISQRAMRLCLSVGVAVSVGLSMVRVLTGISIFWFLVPGYAISLFLTFKVPKIFTGIAFDSGGVASGPMTSTFLLPFVIGACEAAGGNVMTDAFGIVAMVAMTPLIAIQLMGYFYQKKTKKLNEEAEREMDEILSFYAQEQEETHDDQR